MLTQHAFKTILFHMLVFQISFALLMLFIVAIISVVTITTMNINYNWLNNYKLHLCSNINSNSGTTEIIVFMQQLGLDCMPYDKIWNISIYSVTIMYKWYKIFIDNIQRHDPFATRICMFCNDLIIENLWLVSKCLLQVNMKEIQQVVSPLSV